MPHYLCCKRGDTTVIREHLATHDARVMHDTQCMNATVLRGDSKVKALARTSSVAASRNFIVKNHLVKVVEILGNGSA